MSQNDTFLLCHVTVTWIFRLLGRGICSNVYILFSQEIWTFSKTGFQMLCQSFGWNNQHAHDFRRKMNIRMFWYEILAVGTVIFASSLMSSLKSGKNLENQTPEAHWTNRTYRLGAKCSPKHHRCHLLHDASNWNTLHYTTLHYMYPEPWSVQ